MAWTSGYGIGARKMSPAMHASPTPSMPHPSRLGDMVVTVRHRDGVSSQCQIMCVCYVVCMPIRDMTAICEHNARTQVYTNIIRVTVKQSDSDSDSVKQGQGQKTRGQQR